MKQLVCMALGLIAGWFVGGEFVSPNHHGVFAECALNYLVIGACAVGIFVALFFWKDPYFSYSR